MKKFILLAAILFSANALADVCPGDNEVVTTTPYKMEMSCPAATIIIEGKRNPEKYETFLGDVPSASEKVSIRSKDNNITPLPTVNSLLPPDKPQEDFKSRLWIVGTSNDIPDVKCVGADSFTIGYDSGGNCSRCARSVTYSIDKYGHIKGAKLQVSSIGEDKGRVWIGSACYQMDLNVWDKLSNGPYHAKYVFKSEDGRTYVAERDGNNNNSNATDVVFPKDFHEEIIFEGKKVNRPAGYCDDGGNYTWYIYANGTLFDTGIIAFSRKSNELAKRHDQ